MPDVVVGRDPAGAEIAIAISEDRERLTDAVTRVATERGYKGVDPEQVARCSGLSVDDFHRHFANVDQCLLAAFDSFLGRLCEHIDEACEEAASWPDKVKTTIAAAFEFVAEVEPVARLFAVDAVRTGPAGIARKFASIDRAALRLKHGRLLYPVAVDLPDAMERTLVAGVVMIVSTHLLSEEAERLADLEAEAVEMVLTPYIGLDRARLVAAA
jgi:AcrR family transcriptional regulator